MTTPDNRTANVAAVRRFWQGFNTHNLDLWDEVCAPEFINHDASLPTPDADLATIKQTIQTLLLTAFPDIQAEEQDLVAQGDKVVVRRIWRGTHRGELMGLAPTGKAVSCTGMALSRLREGKLVEQWVNFDLLSLLQQVGALPAPPQGDR
jgi:predicted ester cyclase